jgi:FKBP-type peptidyl-prolyl cis-trans isomerase
LIVLGRRQNIMQLKYTVLLATGLLAGSAIAYTASVQSDRRTMLKQSVASAMAFVPGVAGSVRAAAAAADDATTAATDADGFITTESGLRYKVLKEGTGAIPQTGQTVKTHYTGTKSSLLRLTG